MVIWVGRASRVGSGEEALGKASERIWSPFSREEKKFSPGIAAGDVWSQAT